VTLSDGQVSKINNHGYDLAKIIDILSRKKPGTKAFKKAQEHRKNYVNWSLKQLNLKGIKELYLEKLVNINYKRNVSRKLKHFTNTLVRDSLQKLCVEKGVLFRQVDNEYNSQRCYHCGWTKKSNRKAKLFHCSHCEAKSDADFNASQNIKIRLTLPKLSFKFRDARNNLRGFFWNPEGCFSSDGEELDSLTGSVLSPLLPQNQPLVTFSC
jgi:transposase